MTKAEIKKRIDLAADYLTKQIQPNGKFIYQRDSEGKIIKGKYNILRHAGAIWALKQYKYPDVKVNKALRYLESKFHHFSEDILVDSNGSYKAGANALAILALHEETREVSTIKPLLNGLHFFGETKKGAFELRVSKLDKKLIAYPFQSEYYPGEVALAFVTAEKYYKALTLIQTTLDSRTPIIHDHWMMQAICKYLSLGLKVNEGYLFKELQLIANEIVHQPELYIKRSTPTACRLEALIPYNKLIGGDFSMQQHIKHLVGNLLKWQCLDEKNPAYGAFIDNNKYQIDYTQHALSALIAYYNTL